MKPTYERAGVSLYLGDCLEYMRGFLTGAVDCVVTDPPYGIGEHGGKSRTRGKKEPNHKNGGWDNERPSRVYFQEIRNVSKNQVVFGGNYFADMFPISRGWIYWRKLMGGDFGDGELIWTSYDRVLKEFTLPNKGYDTQHPTQKPLPLMLWIVENYTKPDDLVFDPFMGVATTGVAALQLGRRFIGIEQNPMYFELAVKRIEATLKQPTLFVLPSKNGKQKQTELAPHPAAQPGN